MDSLYFITGIAIVIFQVIILVKFFEAVNNIENIYELLRNKFEPEEKEEKEKKEKEKEKEKEKREKEEKEKISNLWKL